MLTAHCECGARYKLPETSAGKRARCKKCGQVFEVPAPEAGDAGIIPFSDFDALAGGAAVERPRAAEEELAVAPAGGGSRPSAAMRDAAEEPAKNNAPRGLFGAYFAAVLRSLAFPFSKGGNVITFFILWFVLVIGLIVRFAPFFGFIAALILTGWYLAFQLNTVLGGAANDEDLPELSLSGSWIDDILAPFFKILLTYMLARLPALVFLLTISMPAGMDTTEAVVESLKFLFGSLDFLMMQAANDRISGALLLLLGYMLWPMFVLVTAVGGVAGLVRVDLMAATILKTLPGYLLATAVALASFAAQVGLAFVLLFLGAGLLTKKADFSSFLLWPPLFKGLELFLVIVAMRTIGLYYHHYKSRFAWSWG